MKRQLLAFTLFAAALVFMGCGDAPSTMMNQSLGEQPVDPALGGGETAPSNGGTTTPRVGNVPAQPGSVGVIDNLGSSGCAQHDISCLCDRVVALFDACYGMRGFNDWSYCDSSDLQRKYDRECRDMELSPSECWAAFDGVISQCIGSCGECQLIDQADIPD